MAVNREETLKAAEKLLKQGKMAAAIEEYVRLVEDNPEDWNTPLQGCVPTAPVAPPY